MNQRTTQDNGVDTILPAGRMFTLGLQHVLIMYAGAVTVPLIVGGALGLSTEEIALLISADLLCCGLVSLLQAFGIGKFIGILLVPIVIKLLWLFPPLVTGTTLAALGTGLFSVAIIWAGGGYGAEDFGAPLYLGSAALVVVVTLLVAKFGRGFFSSLSILVGLGAGLLLTIGLGEVSFAGVAQEPWVRMVRPFHFGVPVFSWSAAITMTLVVIITMIESIGLFFSLGVILNRRLSAQEFKRGLRADAAGAVVGGIFNTFPYTSYAQNIGLVGITGVRSRWVCVVAAFILIALALFPKMAHVIAVIPQYVLGGAALIMFGMVAASGICILQEVDFRGNRHNLFIFAISMGVGLIPMISPKFFSSAPEFLGPLLNSGVLLTAITAIVLNLFFNGVDKSMVQLMESDGERKEAPVGANEGTPAVAAATTAGTTTAPGGMASVRAHAPLKDL